MISRGPTGPHLSIEERERYHGLFFDCSGCICIRRDSCPYVLYGGRLDIYFSKELCKMIYRDMFKHGNSTAKFCSKEIFMDSIHNQDELVTPIVDSKERVKIKLASKNEAIPTRWLSQVIPQWDDGKNDYDIWR